MVKMFVTAEQMKIAEAHGLTEKIIRYRVVKAGWDVEVAIRTPKMTRTEVARMGGRRSLNRRWQQVKMGGSL